MEKFDEFDDSMLNRQGFPYQNFALRNSRYGMFYGSQEKHSANAESVYAMESIRIAIKALHKRTSVTL